MSLFNEYKDKSKNIFNTFKKETIIDNIINNQSFHLAGIECENLNHSEINILGISDTAFDGDDFTCVNLNNIMSGKTNLTIEKTSYKNETRYALFANIEEHVKHLYPGSREYEKVCISFQDDEFADIWEFSGFNHQKVYDRLCWNILKNKIPLTKLYHDNYNIFKDLDIIDNKGNKVFPVIYVD